MVLLAVWQYKPLITNVLIFFDGYAKIFYSVI